MEGGLGGGALTLWSNSFFFFFFMLFSLSLATCSLALSLFIVLFLVIVVVVMDGAPRLCPIVLHFANKNKQTTQHETHIVSFFLAKHKREKGEGEESHPTSIIYSKGNLCMCVCLVLFSIHNVHVCSLIYIYIYKWESIFK